MFGSNCCFLTCISFTHTSFCEGTGWGWGGDQTLPAGKQWSVWGGFDRIMEPAALWEQSLLAEWARVPELFFFFSFLIFVLKFYLFIYMATLGLSCGMWDLASWPITELGPPALGAQSLSHRMTREVPCQDFWRHFCLHGLGFRGWVQGGVRQILLCILSLLLLSWEISGKY